jgi:hypothetical protein
MLEQDLLVSAEEDEAPLDAEKELEAMLEVATGPARVDPDWVVELALDQLPEPLRRALGEMAGGELRLPVELRIRRR